VLAYPKELEDLVDKFSALPSIGRKTALRLSFHILSLPEEKVTSFSESLLAAKKNVKTCSVCQNLTSDDTCSICHSKNRDDSIICVVSSPKDVITIEETGEYSGKYHVLHGLLSPMEGIGPEDIKIKELMARLTDNVNEVIIATGSTVEGEATATYLARLIKPMGAKVSRIASGLPIGSDLEYADNITISHAISGRREM